MANNLGVTTGVDATIKTTDTAGVHTPHHNIDTIIPGTAATSLGKAEDAAHTTGDTGVMALAVRQDTHSDFGADGDYVPLRVTAGGGVAVEQTNSSGTTLDCGSGASGAATQRVVIASDQIAAAVTSSQTISAGAQVVTLPTDVMVPCIGNFVTCSTDITRPADVNAYTANDAWSDSTSAPTTGGFTLTSAARASGKCGIITDITIISSNDPATLLQGEFWIFDSAATAVNDNAAFALSDADAKLLVGVVPFTMATTVGGSGTNSYAQVQNLNLGFTCVGSANLRYLVKVKNAYTPASAEVLTVRAKIWQIN